MKQTFMLIIIMSLMTLSSPAAQYHVSKLGSDTNDGASVEKAFLTIQKGVNALKAGDTLNIYPGEYRESVKVKELGEDGVKTTIRAQILGTVLLRGDKILTGFKKVAGYRFVYVTDFKSMLEPQVVNELDTFKVFQGQPNVAQLEMSPGTFYHDNSAGRIYLSSSDLESATEHRYSVSVNLTHGLYVLKCKNVVIEGLSATGFNTNKQLSRFDKTMGAMYGFFLADSSQCVIRSCQSYLNGCGIGMCSSVKGSGDNVIEKSIAWANYSEYGWGDHGGINIFGKSKGSREVVRECTSFFNHIYGINVYAVEGARGYDEKNRNLMIDNAAWSNEIADFKIKTGNKYSHKVIGSVGPGLWSASNPSRSILGHQNRPYTKDNIILDQEKDINSDSEFADPVNHDYRLQAGSRFIKVGLDKKDCGPQQYAADIYYVKTGGSDRKDGLSVKNAFKTISKAVKKLKAGNTLYILKDKYRLPAAMKLPDSAVISGRGRQRPVLTGRSEISGKGLIIKNVVFKDNIIFNKGVGNKIKSCEFAGSETAARDIDKLTIVHTSFSKGILKLNKVKKLYLSGCAFDGAEKAAVILDKGSSVRYADYNSYANESSCWEIAGKVLDFKTLRQSHDKYSLVLKDKKGTSSLAQILTGGPHNSSLGGHSVADRIAVKMKLFGPYVHSVTDTTANLEWWVSKPGQYKLQWGETEKLENKVVVECAKAGNYSLVNLEPGHTYFFQVKPDSGMNAEKTVDIKAPVITFKTSEVMNKSKTYYVAKGGDKNNDGLSREKAFLSVQQAADKVLPGDTVLISGGTYSEAVRIRAGGVPGRPVTFKAVKGEKVIFDGLDRSLSFAFFASHKPHLRFDGFYFRGYKDGSSVVPWAYRSRGLNGCFVLYYSDDVQITRCFNDGRGIGYATGLLMALHSKDVLVKNSVIIRTMSGGISFAGCPGMRIENNVFLENLISHVSEGMNRPEQKFYLKNNIITDNIPAKTHVPMFAIGKVESMVEGNNCYHLRIHDEKRRMWQFYGNKAFNTAAAVYKINAELKEEPFYTELTRMSHGEYVRKHNIRSESVFRDPKFKGALKMPPKNYRGIEWFSFDFLLTVEDLDFDDLFATDKEVVKLDIGLQKEEFEDYKFNNE